jgi:hypothetical protein
MRLARLGRLLLAAFFLAATQLALVHPLAHVGHGGAAALAVDEKHAADLVHAQACDVCVAASSLAAGAVSTSSLKLLPVSESFSAAVGHGRFVAAFTPLFRSQAPPAFL